MKLVSIDKKQWENGLDSLRASYRLLGPSKEKDYYSFKHLQEGEQPDFSFMNTRLSPKSLLFPQSEAIIEYSLDSHEEDHHVMKAIEADASPRAVLGIRPCDAKAVTLVNLNFDTDAYKDPYWVKALAATTFIGLACDEPKSTCFCTSVGCGPYHEEGLDLLLVDNGETYLAKILTEKGEKFFKTAGWDTHGGDTTLFDSKKEAAEAKIVSTVTTNNLKGQDILDLHGAPFWEDVSFSCI